MNTKNAITLLESICDDKKAFLDIAKAYAEDKLNLYHSFEGYLCIKEEDIIPFEELPEFEGLRNKIAKIEKADSFIDEFFEINDDIDLINKYVDEEMLIPYDIVDDYDNDEVDEEFTSSVSPLREPSEPVPEPEPEPPGPSGPSGVPPQAARPTVNKTDATRERPVKSTFLNFMIFLLSFS